MENQLSQKLLAELNRFNTNGEVIRLSPNGDIFFTSPYKNELNIGNISIENEITIYRKDENEAHILRNINGWSINTTILNVVNIIEYSTDEAIYTITRTKAYEHGKTHSHNSFGLDNKVAVPLPYWTKKYKSKEKQIAIKLFGESWGLLLHHLISSPIFKGISERIKKDRAITGVNPTPENVFRAFHLTPLEETVLIIIGNEPDSAKPSDGLAYSNSDILHQVFNMIEDQLYSGFMLDKEFDLEKWATQGILLLNRTLTTPYGYPNGHKDIGWDYFCEQVIINALNVNPKIILFTWEKDIEEFISEIIIRNEILCRHIHLLNDDMRVFDYISKNIKDLHRKQLDW